MITTITNNVIYIDVDETLLIPASPELFIPTEPNLKLIEKIKKWKAEGKSIIVWTSNGGGVEWAIDAVKRCNIEEYVDLCLPKPYTIVDDDHLEYYSTIDPITLEFK
jgi:hypothetical protein